MAKAVLKIFGKELKIVELQGNYYEMELALEDIFPLEEGKRVVDPKLVRLVFHYEGKKRMCECGETQLLIFEFKGVRIG